MERLTKLNRLVDVNMRLSRGYFKIRRAVVELVSVPMVENFKRLEISPNLFFHHKPVLENIASRCGKGMLGFINIPISLVQRLAGPLVVFFSTMPRIAVFLTALFRASETVRRGFQAVVVDKDSFFAPVTFNFGHWHSIDLNIGLSQHENL
jgi:hypothetical protein